MEKLAFIILLFITTSLSAGQLDLWRFDKTRSDRSKSDRADAYAWVRGQSWRHPAELWNEINYEESPYWYVIVSPNARRLNYVKAKRNEDMGELITTITYDRYGYNRNTREWELYQRTLREYREKYAPQYDVEGSTRADKGKVQ